MWRRVGRVCWAAGVALAGCAGTPGPGGDAGQSLPADAADPSLEPDRDLRRAKGCAPDGAVARVLFEIPRAGEVSDDFFRLPFPNDLRRRDGRLDLSELPRRGSDGLGFDLVDRYARALEQENAGAGLNPTVFFRLTRPADLRPGASAHGPGAIFFVDLTAGTTSYGRRLPHQVAAAQAGRYFCGAGLVVQPALTWQPLVPGHRYAVVLTRALTDTDGTPFLPDLDLRVLLAGRAPPGEERQRAWQVYAPLRAWLAETKVPADTVVGAAVFTTQTIDTLSELRAAVQKLDAPRVTELTRCGQGQSSSCDDDRVPGCAAASADGAFVEYRGLLRLPVFQTGTPPYEDEGGGLARGPDGRPRPERDEEVCFGLSVPRRDPPAGGWPLVVYGHGTGGSFRSHLESGLAEELAAGAIDEGSAVPLAMLGYDGVLHGSRRGESTRSIEELVYNFANPAAARGNTWQAAADLFALARALPALAGAGLPLAATPLALYGHSQGGTAAALAAAHEPRFGLVVLSGTGGALTLSLLGKTRPVPIAPLFPFLLGDDAPVDATHPILSLVQTYFDAADPLNHAGRILAGFADGAPVRRHLLHVFGASDQYTPDITQLHLARAAGLPVLHPVPSAGGDGAPVVEAPVRANLSTGAGRVTAVQAQYLPDGYDGHFVSTRNPAARAAVQRMLGTFFRDDAPVVE
jgi:hypothetical protein